MNARAFLLPLLLAAASLTAQTAPVWQIQNSGTTASLRGIHTVDGPIAWASGSGGTVLRTVDGGQHWQRCATPDGEKDGATLDFRGVQAWDAETAIVMASGPGEKSRLYKTTDGCRTWKLVFANPDKEGFWDAISMGSAHRLGMLLGDPVRGRFQIFATYDFGETWRPEAPLPPARKGESAFAASNSSFGFVNSNHFFVTGGSSSRFILYEGPTISIFGKVGFTKKDTKIPIARASSAGAFSVGFHGEFRYGNGRITSAPSATAVGGDYTKPNESAGTAAYSLDGGAHWTASTQPPHGYRSTVQWFEVEKLWITAGTNGSDFSTDDGRTWHPLDDGNWNALSLPFLVGPKGRIARVNLDILRAQVKQATAGK